MNQRVPLFLLILTFFVFSCGTENEPTYILTTTVSPSEGGSISPSEGEFTEGESITLTGTPTDDGWVFRRWEGDWSDTSNPVSITIDKNYNIVGVFERKEYPLNITIEGEGTVTETIVSQPTIDYTYETIVELTPNPSEGWRFVGWGGDLGGSESPQQITIDGEKNVVVRFQRRDYPLNITIEGEGTVTETIISQPTIDYTYETIVELTPNPSEGWSFVEWSGDLSGSQSPQQITIDEEKNVSVRFEPTVYLSENGVTIMCPDGKVGEIGIVDGVQFEVVDKPLLEQRRNEGGDLTKVCVSNVTNMLGMFMNSQFNQPIGNWDVSNVTSMNSIFENSPFNQPIGDWDVSSVTDMNGMFSGSPFNQPIGNWDVSNVTGVRGMFYESSFNQPIENWDVSNVKRMSRMFSFSQFNQPIGNWDVSNVIDMSEMFRGSQFNQPIGDWDVSSVTDMEYLFMNSQFNQPIGNWDVSNVTDMGSMFQSSQFNQPIGDWDVSNVTNMTQMFYESSFNQPIGNWDVSNVTSMGAMFRNSPFNQPIENWDVSSVTNMNGMFRNSQFNQPINGWCVTQIPSEPLRFSTDSPLTEENKPIWGTCPD